MCTGTFLLLELFAASCGVCDIGTSVQTSTLHESKPAWKDSQSCCTCMVMTLQSYGKKKT